MLRLDKHHHFVRCFSQRLALTALLLFAALAFPAGLLAQGKGGGGGGIVLPKWEMTVIQDARFKTTAAHHNFKNDGSYIGTSYGTTGEAEYFIADSVNGIRYLNDMLSPADLASYYVSYWNSQVNDVGLVGAALKFRDSQGVPVGGHRAALITLPAGGAQYATIEILGLLPGETSNTFKGLNNLGEVVGNSTPANKAYFSCPLNGESFLPLGAGHVGSSASQISNDGSVYGQALLASGSRAVWWPSPYSSPTVLPYIAVGVSGLVSGNVNAANTAGYAVGQSSAGKSGSTNILRAAKWNLNTGTVKNLGSLGGTSSTANSINLAGKTVGFGTKQNNASLAIFYHSDATGLFDLKPQIINFPTGASFSLSGNPIINDSDEIMVHLSLSDGTIRPALLRRVQ